MEWSVIIYSAASLGVLGTVFGAFLGYASIKFAVQEDERLEPIKSELPGANCGGCGFAGCEALAKAILKGEAKPNACPVGSSDMVIKISDIMGIVPEIKEREVAFVKCKGNCEKSVFRYDYEGMNDCNSATQLAGGGSKACSYGCLGNGSCVNVCLFGAITIVDGIAVVDKEKCTACGQCVKTCPKSLIELIPHKSKVFVNCSSKDNGKTVRANCKVGCIGCKLCEKECKFDAIHVEDFIAKIDYDKCVSCNLCVKKCPMSAITSETFKKEDVKKEEKKELVTEKAAE